MLAAGRRRHAGGGAGRGMPRPRPSLPALRGAAGGGGRRRAPGGQGRQHRAACRRPGRLAGLLRPAAGCRGRPRCARRGRAHAAGRGGRRPGAAPPLRAAPAGQGRRRGVCGAGELPSAGQAAAACGWLARMQPAPCNLLFRPAWARHAERSVQLCPVCLPRHAHTLSVHPCRPPRFWARCCWPAARVATATVPWYPSGSCCPCWMRASSAPSAPAPPFSTCRTARPRTRPWACPQWMRC